MKKLLPSLLAFGLFIAPTTAFAIETRAEEELVVKDAIEDDFYGFGGRLIIDEKITGDAVIGGGEVEVNNEITEDLTVLGGEIDINKSIINDDLRFAGGEVRIKQSHIRGHVVGASGVIYIDDDTVIEGDVKLAGGEIRINGTINGNVQIAAGQLKLGDSAKISGDLEYASEEVIEDVQSYVSGTAQYVAFDDDAPKYKPHASEKIWALIGAIVQMAILAGFLFLLAQRFCIDTIKTFQKETGKSYLVGIFFALLGWAPFILILAVSIALGLWWFLSWITVIIFLEKTLLCVFGLAYVVDHYKVKDLGQKFLWLTAMATLIELYNFVMSHLVGLGFMVELALFIGVFSPLIGAALITKSKIMKTYNAGKISIH